VDDLTRLLLRARAGEQGALEGFVRQSSPEIRRFAAHVLGTSEADDALQEIYLAAWRALPAFRGESSARTWLFVIARRTVGRLAAVRMPRPEQVATVTLAARPGTELPLELAQLLRELDDDRRVPFVLTQLLGFSYAETATICECPIGTVRSRVARAREQLVLRLHDEGGRGTSRATEQRG
jgi:RNA polymerase sigma-70 factor (ECF subfamily)